MPSQLKFFSGGPMPSRLNLAWRTHAQSTKICPGGAMPRRLKFGLPFSCTNQSRAHLVHLSCTDRSRAPISLVHTSRTSHAPPITVVGLPAPWPSAHLVHLIFVCLSCTNQMWRMGCITTRWWIEKESYDQNLYSG